MAGRMSRGWEILGQSWSVVAGVYLYASEGKVPDGFSEDSLRSAFKVKK